MRQRRLIIAALLIISPFAANADLIEGLCDGGADASVTCDTSTGLEWLDLTVTVGFSINDFLADVGGWTSDGWSIATSPLVDQLLMEAGFTDLFGNPLANQIFAADLMTSLLGNTFALGSVWPDAGGQGLALDLDRDLIVGPLYQTAPAAGFAIGSSNCCFGDTFSSAEIGIGIWANRAGSVPVPEPGTLALLSLGLAGMGMARRRKKV